MGERGGHTVGRHWRTGDVDERRIVAIMEVALTMRHEMNIVEVGNWQVLGDIGVVGVLETGDVHRQDGVVL